MYTRVYMEEKLIEPVVEEPTTPKVEKKAVLLSAQKVPIVSICAFLFLVFGGIVVFSSQHGEGAPSATPTPVPDGLFQVGEQGQFSAKQQQQQQVQGAKTQQQQQQIPPMPTKPPATPSPSPSPTPSPSPSPTKLEISDVKAETESNKATISWKTNKDADYILIYWKSSEGETGKKVKEASDKKSSQSVEVTGLDGGTEYKYKITAKDSDNTSNTSEEKSFTTK
jgi:hypothetical protein